MPPSIAAQPCFTFISNRSLFHYGSAALQGIFAVAENVDVAAELIHLVVGTSCLNHVVIHACAHQFAALFAVPTVVGVAKFKYLVAPSVENRAVKFHDGFVLHFPNVAHALC